MRALFVCLRAKSIMLHLNFCGTERSVSSLRYEYDSRLPSRQNVHDIFFTRVLRCRGAQRGKTGAHVHTNNSSVACGTHRRQIIACVFLCLFYFLFFMMTKISSTTHSDGSHALLD